MLTPVPPQVAVGALSAQSDLELRRQFDTHVVGPIAADTLFGRALAIFQEYGLVWEEAETHLVWGRFLGDAGKRAAAEAQLAARRVVKCPHVHVRGSRLERGARLSSPLAVPWAWHDGPGEYRSILRRIVVTQCDTEPASVEQQISAPSGLSASPCATSGSAQWYFTTGETLVNASMGLTLINPYPSDAIADLSFSTDQGLEVPTEFQGLVVPAGSLLHVDVGSHLRRRRSAE